MDILFILLGIAVFFAAAAVFSIDHFEINPAQAAVSFLVPPFAWWLYYHHWQRARMIALTQFIASLLLLGGLGMNIFLVSENLQFLSSTDKEKTQQIESINFVGSDEALRELAAAERNSSTLNGRLKGQVVKFNSDTDVAEFDFNGTLRIKLGKDFFGDFEVAIEFQESPAQTSSTWSKTVRQNTENAPTIYLSWLDKETRTIKSLKFDSGYDLDLKLTHEEYNFYSGFIQLVLPDPDKSFLVGNIPIYSSRLRFHGEGIIRHHDSFETLEVIANQSFKSTYKKEVDTVYGFQETSIDFRTGDGIGRSNVILKNKNGVLKRVPLIFYKNENGWYLDVKGLKDLLKSDEGKLVSVPVNLSKVLEVDFKNIGDIQVSETDFETVQVQTQVENNVVSEQASNSDTNLSSAQDTVESVNTQKQEVAENAQVQIPDILKIDVISQEADVPELLKGLMNTEVELQTTEGKFKNGIYVGVHRKQVILEEELGGGVVEFLTEYTKIKSIRVLNAPSRKPQKVEFFSGSGS